MSIRQLFISHKHIVPDKEIAKVLGDFVRNRSSNTIDVHLSSDPDFGGPEIGGQLKDQLCGALSKADVVLLVYTHADNDWSYCMWECGVATDANTAATNVKVIQCTGEVPNPFASDVRVDARDYDSVEGFVRSFMTFDGFFPSGGPVTNFQETDDQVKKDAQALFVALEAVLPSSEKKKPVSRTAWPYVAIEMNSDQIKALQGTTNDDREEIACKVLRESHVVENDQAEGLFGINFEKQQKVEELLNVWKDKHPDLEPDWFKALAVQLVDGAKRLKEPEIRWRPLVRSSDGAKFLLVLGRTCSYPDTGAMRFEVFFFVAEPEAFAGERMILREQISSGKADPEKCKDTTLESLLAKFDESGHSRMPYFGEGDEPRFIVHRSMVDRFALSATRGGKELVNLTVADLLADEKLRPMFEESFAVTSADASLDDVRGKMASIKNCQDVFITEDGGPDSAVTGWITNTMIGT